MLAQQLSFLEVHWPGELCVDPVVGEGALPFTLLEAGLDGVRGFRVHQTVLWKTLMIVIIDTDNIYLKKTISVLYYSNTSIQLISSATVVLEMK